MAHYIAYATKAGTTRPQRVLAEVLQMLEAGIWAVPTTAQLKMKLTSGDGLLVAVGSPHRLFVGDAVVASPYHRFADDEAAKMPPGLKFEHGITLAHARIWPKALPIMDAWLRTTASRTNPNAQFFGAISTLHSVDAAMIVAAGTGELAHRTGDRQEPVEQEPPRRLPGTSVGGRPVSRHDAETEDGPRRSVRTPPAWARCRPTIVRRTSRGLRSTWRPARSARRR